MTELVSDFYVGVKTSDCPADMKRFNNNINWSLDGYSQSLCSTMKPIMNFSNDDVVTDVVIAPAGQCPKEYKKQKNAPYLSMATKSRCQNQDLCYKIGKKFDPDVTQIITDVRVTETSNGACDSEYEAVRTPGGGIGDLRAGCGGDYRSVCLKRKRNEALTTICTGGSLHNEECKALPDYKSRMTSYCSTNINDTRCQSFIRDNRSASWDPLVIGWCRKNPGSDFCQCIPKPADPGDNEVYKALKARPDCYNNECTGSVGYVTTNQSGVNCPNLEFCIQNQNIIDSDKVDLSYVQQNCMNKGGDGWPSWLTAKNLVYFMFFVLVLAITAMIIFSDDKPGSIGGTILGGMAHIGNGWVLGN